MRLRNSKWKIATLQIHQWNKTSRSTQQIQSMRLCLTDSLSYLSRYLDKPTKQLWTVDQRVLRYLKKIKNVCLIIKHLTLNFQLTLMRIGPEIKLTEKAEVIPSDATARMPYYRLQGNKHAYSFHLLNQNTQHVPQLLQI